MAGVYNADGSMAVSLVRGGSANHGRYAADGSLNIGLSGGSTKTMAWVGDSITEASKTQNTATNTFNTQRGIDFWTRTLSGQRIYSPQSLNFGVSGDDTTDVIARLSTIKASGAGAYFVLIGTNDIGVNSFSTITTNLATIWDALLDTGAVVFAGTILPRTLATQSSRDLALRVNNWIRQQHQSRPLFHVVDVAHYFGDPSSSTWAPKTNYSYDATPIHPTGLGAYFIGKQIATAINTVFPKGPIWTLTSAADLWSADNVSGNLLANGLFTGTGGTKTNGSGDLATSWTLAYGANGGTVSSLTAVGSQPTYADGSDRTAQKITIGGTATGAGSAAVNNATVVVLSQSQTSTFTNYTAGNVIRAAIDFSVDASAASIAAIELQMLFTVGGTSYTIGEGSSMGDVLPTEAFSGTLLTEAFTIPSGTMTLARLGVRTYLKNGSISPVLGLTVTGAKMFKVT